jgi:hypothetical protein
MVAHDQTWTADWPNRLQGELRKQGFETVNDFLQVHPAEPYIKVVSRIAPWVAAMQLERLQMQESKRQGTVRDAAMDAFVRELNGRLPTGWVPDSATESRAAGAFAAATTLIEINGESPEFRSQMFAMYKTLQELKPPLGWRPSGPNDKLIQEAFAHGWPITK